MVHTEPCRHGRGRDQDRKARRRRRHPPLGPPFFADEAGEPTRQACYFAACNRNKRSLTVDMATSEGRALIRELARQSDVVVENFKTGGLKRYGLDYDSLRELNHA